MAFIIIIEKRYIIFNVDASILGSFGPRGCQKLDSFPSHPPPLHPSSPKRKISLSSKFSFLIWSICKRHNDIIFNNEKLILRRIQFLHAEQHLRTSIGRCHSMVECSLSPLVVSTILTTTILSQLHESPFLNPS